MDTLQRYSLEVVTLDVEEESDTENALYLYIKTNETDTPSFQVKVGNWYAFFLEKYQYWYIGLVLEVQSKDQVKVDFLQ